MNLCNINSIIKTCKLFNIIHKHNGIDISDDIYKLVSEGANLTYKRPYMYDTGHNCDVCIYDDFDESGWIYEYDIDNEPKERVYYPIWFAIKCHCHPNVIKTLYDISGGFKDKSIQHIMYHDNIRIDYNISLKKIMAICFGHLYYDSFYIEKTKEPSSYFFKQKKLADTYLTILELDHSTISFDPRKLLFVG